MDKIKWCREQKKSIELVDMNQNLCDEYFENDTEIEQYCKDKNIPNE